MKKYSALEAKEKIQRYCAYQERCHQEVRVKLFEYGLSKDEIDELIAHLITSNFLNEERYAKAFAGGKFRMKKWGRLKIVHALEAKGLTPRCIKSGLEEIEEDDYEKVIREYILLKEKTTSEENIYAHRDKISKAAILKGYEPELVWKMLREVLPDQR